MRTIDGELIFIKQPLTLYIKEFIDKYDISESKVYIVDQSHFKIMYQKEYHLYSQNLSLNLYDYTDEIINEMCNSDYIFISKFDINKVLYCYQEKRYYRMKKLASL